MARDKDQVVADVKKIRRKLSKRLMDAHKKGKLHQELIAVEREGERAYREAIGGTKNGKSKRMTVMWGFEGRRLTR